MWQSCRPGPAAADVRCSWRATRRWAMCGWSGSGPRLRVSTGLPASAGPAAALLTGEHPSRARGMGGSVSSSVQREEDQHHDPVNGAHAGQGITPCTRLGGRRSTALSKLTACGAEGGTLVPEAATIQSMGQRGESPTSVSREKANRSIRNMLANSDQQVREGGRWAKGTGFAGR